MEANIFKTNKKSIFNNVRAFKYIWPLLSYSGAVTSFTSKGLLCFSSLIVTWIIIPVVELLLKANQSNLSEEQEEDERKNPIYDYLLYIMVILQIPTVFLFLSSMQDQTLTLWEKAARIATMGLFCGTSAINIGHELGHRSNKFEKILANASLLTSLYMHYLIEHIKGHHKIAATHEDPSTARYGEPLYIFWVRCFIFGYLSAWKIANKETRKAGKSMLSLSNEMILLHIIQGLFVLLVLFAYGAPVTGYFMLAALTGILLFESVSYIEHYGLTRKTGSEGKLERIKPVHSWDSEYTLSRLLLFNSPRHSDHHYLASRKYQILRYQDTAPKMPTGYSGMILLALVPTAWFYVMNPKIKAFCRRRQLMAN